MKLVLYSLFLVMCFTIFSCSHNPLESFQEIQVGTDKSEVLDKLGSPLRSRFQNGKNIWTYRFYEKSSDNLLYKDIIIEGEKVVEIKNSAQVDIKEIERKEKLVEDSVKSPKSEATAGKPTAKPQIDDSILNDSSKKDDAGKFVPVE